MRSPKESYTAPIICIWIKHIIWPNWIVVVVVCVCGFDCEYCVGWLGLLISLCSLARLRYFCCAPMRVCVCVCAEPFLEQHELAPKSNFFFNFFFIKSIKYEWKMNKHTPHRGEMMPFKKYKCGRQQIASRYRERSALGSMVIVFFLPFLCFFSFPSLNERARAPMSVCVCLCLFIDRITNQCDSVNWTLPSKSDRLSVLASA